MSQHPTQCIHHVERHHHHHRTYRQPPACAFSSVEQFPPLGISSPGLGGLHPLSPASTTTIPHNRRHHTNHHRIKSNHHHLPIKPPHTHPSSCENIQALLPATYYVVLARPIAGYSSPCSNALNSSHSHAPIQTHNRTFTRHPTLKKKKSSFHNHYYCGNRRRLFRTGHSLPYHHRHHHHESCCHTWQSQTSTSYRGDSSTASDPAPHRPNQSCVASINDFLPPRAPPPHTPFKTGRKKL